MPSQGSEAPEYFILRQKLQTLIGTELGVLSNNQPAIWIDPPRIPTELSCKGLLCRITRYKKMNKSEHSHSGNQAYRNFDWEVFLVQYDVSSAGMRKLDIAKDKLERAFPRQRNIVLESANNVFPQIRFLFNFSEYLNTSP
jgi:hypothetical protein